MSQDLASSTPPSMEIAPFHSCTSKIMSLSAARSTVRPRPRPRFEFKRRPDSFTRSPGTPRDDLLLRRQLHDACRRAVFARCSINGSVIMLWMQATKVSVVMVSREVCTSCAQVRRTARVRSSCSSPIFGNNVYVLFPTPPPSPKSLLVASSPVFSSFLLTLCRSSVPMGICS